MTFCANFSRLSKSRWPVKLNRNLFLDCCLPPLSSAQRKDQITRRRQNGAEHSAPEHPNSTAVAWVWNPVSPDIRTIDRDQTLGLRSVVPLASSSDSLNPVPSHLITPRCEAVLLLPIQSTVFLRFRQIRGTASNNGALACNQLRVSATRDPGNPRTVENLCKP